MTPRSRCNNRGVGTDKVELRQINVRPDYSKRTIADLKFYESLGEVDEGRGMMGKTTCGSVSGDRKS